MEENINERLSELGTKIFAAIKPWRIRRELAV